MEVQIGLLKEKAKKLETEFKNRHFNNKREKKIVKMLQHFNDRLNDLKSLNQENNKHILICKYILSDLNEMINQVEYLIKERS